MKKFLKLIFSFFLKQLHDPINGSLILLIILVKYIMKIFFFLIKIDYVQSFISALSRLTPMENLLFLWCLFLWSHLLYLYLHDIITNKNFHPVVEKLLIILSISFCSTIVIIFCMFIIIK
jgi:hypothetical protein